MPELKIVAEARTEFGKGAARRIRRADKVPAVLYGHGTDPVHVTLPGHETMLALKNSNALLSVQLDTGEQLALPKQVQRDPIRGTIEHVDLIIVRRGEKVEVEINIHLEGEAKPDTLVVTENSTLLVEAEATAIPEQLTVSIEGAEVGTQIFASDVTLPEGASLVTDPETMVVNVIAPPTEEELEAELEEAEAEAGIERDESEDEAAEGEAAAEDGESGDGESSESGGEGDSDDE